MPPNMASIIEENKYLKWDFCEKKPTCITKHACLPVQINSAFALNADLSRHKMVWGTPRNSDTELSLNRERDPQILREHLAQTAER